MLLDRWNGSTARLMTDPRLLEVLRELKPLMDMFSHSPLNLFWFTCTPSRFSLMMTFSNTPMSSSYHLTFGILLFWTMELHLPFLRKFTEKLMIPCSQIQCLMYLGVFTSECAVDVFWDSSPPETGEHTFHAISTRLTLLRLIGNPADPILDGNLNNLSKIHTRLPQGLEVLSLNMITSRNISSPGILFSMFPGGMNLLLLIQSIVTNLQ